MTPGWRAGYHAPGPCPCQDPWKTRLGSPQHCSCRSRSGNSPSPGPDTEGWQLPLTNEGIQSAVTSVLVQLVVHVAPSQRAAPGKAAAHKSRGGG